MLKQKHLYTDDQIKEIKNNIRSVEEEINRLKVETSKGFKKQRALLLCMYRWRSATFATDFAVTMNDMEEQMAQLEARRNAAFKKLTH